MIPAIRLLIIADDPLARAGLAGMLRSLTGYTIVGQIDAPEANQTIWSLYQPELILWDLGWEPTSDSLSPLKDIIGEADAHFPIVALLPDTEWVTAVWSTCVRGILPRHAGINALHTALQSVYHGNVTLDPEFAHHLMPTNDTIPDLIEPLTPREREVLQLVSAGLSNRAIATRLHISAHTVKFHVNALLSKLQAQSRTEAVVKATRWGLISL